MYSEVLTASRSLLLAGFITDIYSLRFIKPFDESYFISIAEQYTNIIFVEDGVETGGVSQYLSEVLTQNKMTKNIKKKILAFPEKFLPNGTRAQILEEAGLSTEKIS